MNYNEVRKALVVPYSIWLPIANVWRICRNSAAGRSFAVGVAGLRTLYMPPKIPRIARDDMLEFLGCSDEGVAINWPRIDRRSFDTIGGGTVADRLCKLALLLRVHKSHTAFEIGTFVGAGSTWIAMNLEEGGHLYTLDLPFLESPSSPLPAFSYASDRRVASFENRKKRVFHSRPIQSRITELFGDSRSFNYRALGCQFDFFYVDGDHALEAVAKDTLAAFSVLAPRGFVVWDDYLPYHIASHPDVATFINYFNESVDRVFDIGGQAAWFGCKSEFTPAEIRDKCEKAIRSRWPELI